jgi:hypothetical protein
MGKDYKKKPMTQKETLSLISSKDYFLAISETKKSQWYITPRGTLCSLLRQDEKYYYSREAGSSVKTDCRHVVAYLPKTSTLNLCGLLSLPNINVEDVTMISFVAYIQESDETFLQNDDIVQGYYSNFPHICTEQMENDLDDTQQEIDSYQKEIDVLSKDPVKNKLQIYFLQGKMSSGQDFVDVLKKELKLRKNI